MPVTDLSCESVAVRTDLRKSMPILEMVAGEAQERSWVSKTKLTLEPNWILSPLGIVRRWLSSK